MVLQTLVVDLNGMPISREEFVRPLEDIARKYGKTKTLHYLYVSPKDITWADRIILSGTPLMEFGYLAHTENFSWLKDVEKPVIGICAGMQVIAEVFGSDVIGSEGIGFAEIETKRRNILFEGRLKVYELHSKAVKLSDELETLAESDSCVQAFKHKKRPIYGILFHPEARNRQVIERFLERAQSAVF